MYHPNPNSVFTRSNVKNPARSRKEITPIASLKFLSSELAIV
jgi:hypothetical protein